jgi:hypothetical protein
MWKVVFPIVDGETTTYASICLPGSVSRDQAVKFAMAMYKNLFSAIFDREMTMEDLTAGKLLPPQVERISSRGRRR